MTNQEFIESITLPGEEWRLIIGFEDLYLASSFGRIVSLEKYVYNRFQYVRKEPKLLVPHNYPDGRQSITLSKNKKDYKKHLSRLIGELFIPNPNNYPILEHLDGDISNNRVDNLRWRPIKDIRKQYDTSSLEGEEWKDIPGYEGIYKISSFGRVLSSYSRKILVPFFSGKKNKQYYAITLVKDSVKKRYSIHRLVALTFIPNPNGYTEIDHINTNKDDNRVTNLRWCTSSMNNENPITVIKRNEAARKRQKQDEVVQLQNGVVVEIHKTIREAAKKGFHYICIKDCCEHKIKHHRGFQWMYLSNYEKTLINKSKNALNPDTD